jgi:hypothetical protein
MTKLGIMCDATDKDWLSLPCGKLNMGDAKKRLTFAKLHTKRCLICKSVVNFHSLHKLTPDDVPLKKQVWEDYVNGKYNQKVVQISNPTTLEDKEK